MTSDTKTYVRIRNSEKKEKTQTIFIREDKVSLPPEGIPICIFIKKSIRLEIKRDPQHGLINNQTTAWEFTVDKVFENDPQKTVFNEVSSNMIPMALKGISGTLLCYGQTGAGKTFTMSGVSQRYPDRGIIPRSLAQLFEEIDKMPTYAVLVRLSYIEIYNEQIIDLFNPAVNAVGSKQVSQLVISDAEDEVTVKGLACPLVNNLEDALCVLFEGELNRTVAAHALNRISSRAHTIFTIYLDVRSIADTSGCVKSSRLNYVDLAGSERVRKTQVSLAYIHQIRVI
ncbi:kinesin family member 6/9 [Paragonimus westermani]|uniref:Kinesin family member 6/9 n=1 Tax=Paragonimus westermani TaxID=34504 RepID=A0A5J4NYI4_9TREM|nr:kinesin family member 6/9 [Paragonimus westermani]